MPPLPPAEVPRRAPLRPEPHVHPLPPADELPRVLPRRLLTAHVARVQRADALGVVPRPPPPPRAPPAPRHPRPAQQLLQPLLVQRRYLHRSLLPDDITLVGPRTAA